jgi:3-mercaptopyruvate sulfurtransferase SseA
MGYTNVRLYQAGYPAWKKAYGAAPAVKKAAAKPTKSAASLIKTGPDGDFITVGSFKKLMAEAPDSVHLIDVRSPEEYAAGHMKGAKNLTVDQVEADTDSLPTDKPVVFVCASGARAGEAYDIVKMFRENMKVYYLNAAIEYKKDGYKSITPAS